VRAGREEALECVAHVQRGECECLGLFVITDVMLWRRRNGKAVASLRIL
jgi:hypothetical protein